MRLAFCLFKYVPHRGLERDFLRIANACLAAGHEIYVYTLSWQGERPPLFSITCIPVYAFTNAGRAAQFGQKLLSYLRKEKYDAVIGFNRMPGLDIYYAADPCYCARAREKHGAWYRLLPRYGYYAALEKAVFSPSSKTKILLLNAAHKKEFMRYHQTPEERFELLPAGIGRDRDRPADQADVRIRVRRAAGIAADEKTPTVQHKTYLWIVGKGDIAAMEKLAKKLDIHKRVKFFGPREDIVDFYAASDILLHLSYQETAGMVLIEAMVAGLPVLVTANCGYAAYIQTARAGSLVPEPFQQAVLNQLLLTLLSDEKLLADYRQNALAYVQSHDLFHLPERVVEIIEHVGKA
jgi:UDP-glucose:(heptosyl)LPS alpha-1,3-glucosyltransferase